MILLSKLFNNFFSVTKLAILPILLMADLTMAAAPEKSIVLGVTAPALKSPQVQFAKRIFSEIFESLNYELKIEVLPSIRLVKQTETGAIDGELIRMSGYGKTHPYLTRVDESIFEFSVAIYSNEAHLNLTDWQDLKGLKVGYRRGVKVVENELIKVLNTSDLVQFTDIPNVMKKLSKNRLDAYVGIESLTDEILLRQPEETASNIYKALKLKKESAHLFLGKNASFLAPKVSLALKKMKLSGRYDEIKKQKKTPR